MRRKGPKAGTKRVRSKFLLLPKTMQHEKRWLERATWEEEVVYFVGVFNERPLGYQWIPTRWIDEGDSYP